MTGITLQILEGLERGQVYSDLDPPVTIGREEDNTIQLNDERVSRFHSKIQEDNGRYIITDLESTNGTRVNGHPIQMRVLQIGDQVSIGRCLILVGSREEIKERLSVFSEENADSSESGFRSPSGLLDSDVTSSSASSENNLRPSDLFPQGPPIPPGELRPFQCAEISDFLSYTHEQIRYVLQTSREESSTDPDEPSNMKVNWYAWQHLVQLEMDIAIYLRKLADPDDS